MTGPKQLSHPPDDVFARVARRLREPLPGAEAHRRVWPSHLPLRDLPPGVSFQKAAVLLAIVTDGDGCWIPFVERPQTMPHHPGQIGLPGGGQNESESVEACALREAEEEIALPPDRVEILGRLSPVTIGVSRFRVEVLVGGVRGADSTAQADGVPGRVRAELDLVPQSREVARILRGQPESWRDGPTEEFVSERPVETFRAPAYGLGDALIWGATALMLAEFLVIWKQCDLFDLRTRNATRSGED